MSRTEIQLLVLITALTAFADNADSQDAVRNDNPFLPGGSTDTGWPHIRGPNFDAIAEEIHLAASWPESGPPVLWVKELGQGYSSLVVKDNRAYTQYQSLAGQFVICLDASSGETIWQYRYDWPFETAGLYPGPRSTPTIANERIYFATPSGAVGCLNLAGRLLWSMDLKTQFNGKGTDFGYACSPTIVEGKVIMPIGGLGASMVALDADSGSILWKSGDASASYTPALPITVDSHRQIIGYLEHELVSHDLETGELLWKCHLSSGYDEHSAWPVFHDPYLWTSAPFQAGSQLLKLSGGPGATFERVWQRSVMSNDVSSSVLVDGHLYGFDLAEAQSKAHRPSRGAFRCIDFLTGETKWSNGDAEVRRSTDFAENRASQTIGHTNVIVADGKLILFNDLGELILARVNSEEYVELARTPGLGGEICWTSPALDRGRIFVRNHSRAICIYVGEPGMIGTVATGNIMTVDEVPRGAVVDLSSVLGVEPEYAMDPPTYRWLQVWYLVSLAILGASGLATLVIRSCRRSLTPTQARWVFWSLAGALGLIVGTPASLASREFVFTWPVSLFIAFQIAVYTSIIRRKKIDARSGPEAQTGRARWRDRAIAVSFITLCLIYFLVCRRLSLVTEWIFLCGFAAAAPILLAARALSKRSGFTILLAELGLTIVAYTAFFWSAAALLGLKYDLSAF